MIFWSQNAPISPNHILLTSTKTVRKKDKKKERQKESYKKHTEEQTEIQTHRYTLIYQRIVQDFLNAILLPTVSLHKNEHKKSVVFFS